MRSAKVEATLREHVGRAGGCAQGTLLHRQPHALREKLSGMHSQRDNS